MTFKSSLIGLASRHVPPPKGAASRSEMKLHVTASSSPRAAAARLSSAIKAFYAAPHHTFARAPSAPAYTADALKAAAGAVLADIRRFSPLVHQVCFPPPPLPGSFSMGEADADGRGRSRTTW